MRYVIDASVLVKTVLPENGSDIAAELIRKHRDNTISLVAPDHILVESVNAIWKHVSVLRDVTEDEAGRALSLLRNAGVLYFSAADYCHLALQLAVKYRHPVYDTLYIALARDLNCSVISADETLRRKFGSPPVFALEQFRV